jgi:ABC-2 type transport system permease protein
MPIFDQGYQHWDGELSGHFWRWLAITRHGVRTQLRNRWTRLVLLAALAPALALAGFLVLWGLLEQRSALIEPLLLLLRKESEMRELLDDSGAFRTTIWTLAYSYFFQIQNLFTLLIVLLVGPSLISQDLRFNAMPLYFARPLRRFDYFLGKLGVIGVFLGMVTIAPAMFAYVLGVVFSSEFAVVKDTFHLLAASLLYGVIVVLSAGTLMLALSALSRNSRYVAFMWIGFWVITASLYGVLMGLTQKRERSPDGRGWVVTLAEWPPVVSYGNNLLRINAALLRTHAAWDKIGDLVYPASRPGSIEEFRIALGFSDAEWEKQRDEYEKNYQRVRQQRERWLAGLRGAAFPWFWSAGVLAGLFGISVWILTTRVKSLDRLK